MLEDRAKGIRNLAGRKRSSRNLVGQRLEEMEVTAVDERDLDRRFSQLRDRQQPAETTADDDDAVYLGLEGAHDVPCFRGISSVKLA